MLLLLLLRRRRRVRVGRRVLLPVRLWWWGVLLLLLLLLLLNWDVRSVGRRPNWHAAVRKARAVLDISERVLVGCLLRELIPPVHGLFFRERLGLLELDAPLLDRRHHPPGTS